jgi:hypothetical protein
MLRRARAWLMRLPMNAARSVGRRETSAGLKAGADFGAALAGTAGEGAGGVVGGGVEAASWL